eukprot:Phypoly_transcript_07419.p1 GENE.Phypoly_transcript_07419~~Phypoly_transcript_07419.p1  ORF type:complete len:537 (+),score=55.41 Phypoly_transcript_07419:76-1611(+)
MGHWEDEKPLLQPEDGEKKHLLSKTHETMFTSLEKRNIALFIAGIMCFKFGFESLGGSVAQFVLSRFLTDSVSTLSLLLILYGISQSLGSMLVSQLIRVFRASTVIAAAMIVFAALVSTYILLEFFTGGTLTKEGNWDPYLIFPIYICIGGCLGVMELVRRVIPAFIVGTDSEKLKKMDATVHIFYEIAGTSGAFASTPLIEVLKPVYATVSIPPLFLIGSIFYMCIRHTAPVKVAEVEYEKARQRSAPARFFTGVKEGIINYGMSLYIGAGIVLKNRQFVWLMLGYVLPLVIHRVTESLLFNVFAKQILEKGSLSGVLLGGSNFGELCGAALVLRFSRHVKTPIPWVRFDALALGVLWVLPFAKHNNATLLAIVLVPVMMVLSGAWAAGDVSLLAYIQSHFPEETDEGNTSQISPIGAVMGFLYASYVLTSTMVYYGLGQAFDRYDPQEVFFWVSGVGFTCCGAIIFASSFIPHGSCKFNPDAADLLTTQISHTPGSPPDKAIPFATRDF